ncbi:MAG: helix-turn-helix domain-containing protein [Comamonadaceae bacterium]|nr:MAG: helix-turn-helix domain-containing protein [Comamonadaceae bacterium]
MSIPFCVHEANTLVMESWRDRARTRMKAAGFTQDSLSEGLGMTQGGLQHWLAGTRQPSLEQINQIAALLKVSPAWLSHGIEPLDTLDGLREEAQQTLRRFIAAERRQASPPQVWAALNSVADLAFHPNTGRPSHR